mgnify:CR=1 FL=1
MTKREMLADPNSCLNRAADDEPVFVLLARDVAAPPAISSWMSFRARFGKNMFNDAQLLDAEAVADAMVDWQKVREAKAKEEVAHADH